MGVSRIGYKVSHFLIPKSITMEHSQRRSTCRVKSDPNYIPQTFHSGTNFTPVKIWQARLLWIYLSVCLPICLSRTGGSLVPNQSLLQTKSQSKTCTPGLWFSGAAWIFYLKKNFYLQLSKFDTSKIWQRRSVLVVTQSAPPGFYRKANLESPQY